MLMRGSSESRAEATAQSRKQDDEVKPERSSPRLRVLSVLTNHPKSRYPDPDSAGGNRVRGTENVNSQSHQSNLLPRFSTRALTFSSIVFAVGCVDTLYLRMLAYLAAVCRSWKAELDRALDRNGVVPAPAAYDKAADVVLNNLLPDGLR